MNKSNKKAQGSPMAVFLGIVGGIIGLVVAGRTGTGIIWTLLSGVVCAVVCYMIANKASE